MKKPPKNTVICGDLFDELPTYSAESVDAVVTDPPYFFDGLFGEEWDDFEDEKTYQKWCQEWGEECFRILKPGAHLLAFGSNRQHHRLFTGLEDAGFKIKDTITWHYGNGMVKSRNVSSMASDEQDVPDGLGTQLKPSTEFVVVAQKPIQEDTIAENVSVYGVGALNIDETRVGVVGREKGRHPANTIFDEDASTRLDDQSGELSHGHWTGEDTDGYGEEREYTGPGDYGTTGGASRFFYTSKASTAERTLDGRIENDHISVKPVDLMEYLVRMVSTKGQFVVDPFTGTGTTLRACKNLHRDFLGVELDEKWADVSRARVGLAAENPEVLLTDDDQTTLTNYDE